MKKFKRSRLPVVVAIAVVLLGFAVYGIYRSIHLPKVHVTHVAKNWLDNTSGHHSRPIVHHAHRRHGHRLAHHHRKHHHHRLAHHKGHHRHHARLAHHRKRHRHVQTASYAE